MSHTTVPGRPWLRPWQPERSGNPAGRPPSFLDLAVQIRHLTHNGAELAQFLLGVLHGEPIPVRGRNGGPAVSSQRPTLNHRLQAAQLLLDRGRGRAPQVIEFLGDASPEQQQQTRRAMLEHLTDDERTQLRALLQRALARTMATAPPEAEPDSPAPATSSDTLGTHELPRAALEAREASSGAPALEEHPPARPPGR
jgi:hypothetical protein